MCSGISRNGKTCTFLHEFYVFIRVCVYENVSVCVCLCCRVCSREQSQLLNIKCTEASDIEVVYLGGPLAPAVKAGGRGG